MVWLLQFGQLVVLSASKCGMAVPIWQLVVLSVTMCGMAVGNLDNFGQMF